jgi:hypothetical protein
MADIFAAVGAPPDVLRKAGVEAAADRVIVVKRIIPSSSTPSSSGCSSTRQESHTPCTPNIVQIYDFGSVAERYFIAMGGSGKTTRTS